MIFSLLSILYSLFLSDLLCFKSFFRFYILETISSIRKLLNQLEIDKTYVLGTSAGGTIAIKFALKYPERTKGVILYCSSCPTLEALKKKLHMQDHRQLCVMTFNVVG